MKIVAHRGASAQAPENTLAAVRRAVELGADAVEVDVRLTRDGRLAVLHDDDTRRVAPGQPVCSPAKHTLAELQALDAGTWKGAVFAGERIPALEEVLRALGPAQEILIELKSPERRGWLPALERAFGAAGFPAGRAIIMSFHDGLMRRLKEARPGWRGLRLLSHRPSARWVARFAADVRAGRMDGLGQSRRWTLRAEDYERLRASGAILSVWTVNEPKEVAAWDRRGFAYVTSDVPEKMIGRA
jgi:glycerophosphoryl diester phosphodiesterase